MATEEVQSADPMGPTVISQSLYCRSVGLCCLVWVISILILILILLI